jgi:hypothetical protein
VVRTPIVVPAGTVLLTIKLLIVIAMSLSALARIRFVLCDKFAAARSDHLSGGEYGLLQVEAVAPAEGNSVWRSPEELVDETKHLDASRHEWHVPGKPRHAATQSRNGSSLSLTDLSPLHIQLIYPFIPDSSIPKFGSAWRERSSRLTPSCLQPVCGDVRACSTNESLWRQLCSRRGAGVPHPGTNYLEGKAI